MTTPTTTQALPAPTAAAPTALAPFPAPTVPAAPAPAVAGPARRRSPRPVAVLAAGLGALVVAAAAYGATAGGSATSGGRDHGGTTATSTSAGTGNQAAARLRISQGRAGTTQAVGSGRSGQDLSTSGAVNPNYTMADFLTEVVNDVDGMWTSRLAEAGDRPQVRYHWMAPGQSVTSPCTPKGTSDKTAEYCPADDTIYFSQQMAVNLWTGTFTGSGGVSQQDGGDFAVAVAIAHEFGHNLQDELGLTGTTVQLEDHADCVAGVWANAAYYQGILEPGDADEAVDVMQAIGSREGSDHGTPQERVQAYLTGWNTGDLDTCTATYLGA